MNLSNCIENFLKEKNLKNRERRKGGGKREERKNKRKKA
jgi:hypothetical protein